MVLRELAIDVVPILTGAGIAGLAIGFGAQNLVRDFISGFFIILEDQVRVGDLARINGVPGVVEEINLRTIVVRDGEGAVQVFPNGTITALANLSKHFSFAVVDIRVTYTENVDRAMETIREVGAAMRQEPAWAPLIARADRGARRGSDRRRLRDHPVALQDAAAQPGKSRQRAAAAADDHILPHEESDRMAANDYHFVTTLARRRDLRRGRRRDRRAARPAAMVAGGVPGRRGDRAAGRMGPRRPRAAHDQGVAAVHARPGSSSVTESQLSAPARDHAIGDFVGRGVWTFEQDGAVRRTSTFDWRVTAREAAAAAMVGGAAGRCSRRTIAGRWRRARRASGSNWRAAAPCNVEAPRAIPPPPGPITYAGVAVLGGAAFLGAGALWLATRMAKRSSRSDRLRRHDG